MRERRSDKPAGRRPRGGAVEPAADMQSLDFGRKNWLLLGAGGAAILLGFLLLKLGDITVAPVLLVGGYLVLIPWGLVARPRATVPTREADPPRTDQAP